MCASYGVAQVSKMWMPLPPLEDIKEIGNQIILTNNFSQSIVDELVNDYFDLEHIFAYEQN